MNRKIYFISYGDDKFKQSKIRIEREAVDFGLFDNVKIFGYDNIDDKFKDDFKDILSCKRGGGYWIWKPYFIKKVLNEINDNDILIYVDCGSVINKKGIERFKKYIEIVDNHESGLLTFKHTSSKQLCRGWINEKVFEYFDIKSDNTQIRNSLMLYAGVQVIRKNKNSKKCINLLFNALYDDKHLFTDKYKNYKKTKYFKDNRHDQSLFTLICYIHGTVSLSDEITCKRVIDINKTPYINWPFLVTRIRK